MAPAKGHALATPTKRIKCVAHSLQEKRVGVQTGNETGYGMGMKSSAGRMRMSAEWNETKKKETDCRLGMILGTDWE